MLILDDPKDDENWFEYDIPLDKYNTYEKILAHLVNDIGVQGDKAPSMAEEIVIKFSKYMTKN